MRLPEDMDQSCKQHVERIDTLEFQTFLSSILQLVVNSLFNQEMPFKQWSEWNGL